jgi:hypothetical protein
MIFSIKAKLIRIIIKKFLIMKIKREKSKNLIKIASKNLKIIMIRNLAFSLKKKKT